MKYFVTTIRKNHDSRCIGYYDSIEHAREVAKKKTEWLCEAGWYKWIVIEAFGAGWYPSASIEEWYEMKQSWGKIRAKKIDKPKDFEYLASFGIG